MQQVKQGRLPKYPGEFDVLIGCTALVHNLTLVTRNTRDFTPLTGLALDDWTDIAGTDWQAAQAK